MIPRNIWQVEFMHYPRQQQCGIDLLEEMENNGKYFVLRIRIMLKTSDNEILKANLLTVILSH